MEEGGVQTCEELGAAYPLGRTWPADIANLCLFLSSGCANTTGENVMCGGGIMGMGPWGRRVGFGSYRSYRSYVK